MLTASQIKEMKIGNRKLKIKVHLITNSKCTKIWLSKPDEVSLLPIPISTVSHGGGLPFKKFIK